MLGKVCFLGLIPCSSPAILFVSIVVAHHLKKKTYSPQMLDA